MRSNKGRGGEGGGRRREERDGGDGRGEGKGIDGMGWDGRNPGREAKDGQIDWSTDRQRERGRGSNTKMMRSKEEKQKGKRGKGLLRLWPLTGFTHRPLSLIKIFSTCTPPFCSSPFSFFLFSFPSSPSVGRSFSTGNLSVFPLSLPLSLPILSCGFCFPFPYPAFCARPLSPPPPPPQRLPFSHSPRTLPPSLAL